MILGHQELKNRVDQFFPGIHPEKIGAASVDVRVGLKALDEEGLEIRLYEYTKDNPYFMHSGEFLLIEMLEETRLPQDVSCMFLLKSTSARMGFQHAFAGWVDPGWHGILTMEVTNSRQMRSLPLYNGMPIGQLIFMETAGGGLYHGRYQDDLSVSGPKTEVEYDAGT